MRLLPRAAYDNFDGHLARFTVPADADIEDQYYDRKEVSRPAHGNVSLHEMRDIKRQIQATVSAFANTNPDGGLLIIGISKAGEILGIDHLTESQRHELANIDQLLCNHAAVARLHDCIDRSGSANKLLLVFVPHTDNAICETHEAVPKAWKRAASQNLPLTDRDREALKRDKRIDPFERRLASPYSVDEIDHALLTEIRKTWPNLADVTRSDDSLLYEFGAIERTAHGPMFTNAGLLFFASNPQRVLPAASIRILRYESSHDQVPRGDPSLDRTFTGSVSNQLLRVREFLRDSGLIKVYTVRRSDGAGFEEKPEIPFTVVDEAIVNAVTHREYAYEWGIECMYFRDALIIKNPGRLIQRSGNVPASFRLDERTLSSTPRNPILLNWLRQSKDQRGQTFVRALSEGTQAMLRSMTVANLPAPEYTVTESETIVTLRLDTSLQQAVQEKASEFANLFALNLSGALPADWRRAVLATLRDGLKAAGWFIDRYDHGRLIAHPAGREVPLPRNVRSIVRLYPAYVFALREFQGRRYLIIDYTVEVKNVQTIEKLYGRGRDLHRYIGQRATSKTAEEWRDSKIVDVTAAGIRIQVFEIDQAQTVGFNEVIPKLGIRDIVKELAESGFDLPTEIKRRSLATATNAARQRSDIVLSAASQLAHTVFPLRVSGIEVALASDPTRLEPSSSLVPRTLAEPLVEFGRHKETSNIRDGITEFGAYGSEDKEIELVPIVAEPLRNRMHALIERLKAGAYKYKGAERTFGIRFTYGNIVGIQPRETVEFACRRLLSEHPAWSGNEGLNRLFLVHTPELGFALDDEHSPYFEAKRLILEVGVPCQMVDTPTLENPDWKDLNLALNIAAKCGVVPWVLPEGIPDADFFVGLSYTQHRGDPGTRLMGYANVFNSYGRWLFYSGNAQTFAFDQRRARLAELVEGTLQRLDQLSETPHIYFHYSARFAREDRDALVDAARRVRPRGTYTFVWINAHHPIRLYDSRPENDGSLARGTYIATAPNQIYLSTTGYNPYRKMLGTPLPLEVTAWTYPAPSQAPTQTDLQALARQILSLTKLNWGSSDALTGEPITTKYAGDIAYLTAAFLRQGQSFSLHRALERTPWFL